LIKTKSGNEYLITEIDSATSMPVTYALPARSTDAAIELVGDNGSIVHFGSDDSSEELSQMLKWGIPYFLVILAAASANLVPFFCNVLTMLLERQFWIKDHSEVFGFMGAFDFDVVYWRKAKCGYD
jgi:hypothetical protein